MTGTLRGLLRVRERLVRRGREQQHVRVGLREEIVGELGRLAAGLHVEQIPEALELVQDDEIRLEGTHGCACEHPAQSADDHACRAALATGQSPPSGDLPDQGDERGPLGTLVELLKERPMDAGLEAPCAHGRDVPVDESAPIGHTSLEDPLRRRRPCPPESQVIAQEHVEHGPLPRRPHL